MVGRPYFKFLRVVSWGARRTKMRQGQGDLVLFLLFTLLQENTLSTCITCTCKHFSLGDSKSWYLPRLETFANCDSSVPDISVGFVEFFLPFSFFIKSWEKHLWRIFLRPILLILEQSHCLSTASSDILSHFPRSGSREGVWSQFDSSPLKKQLSSLHCVWRELVKCAIFFFSIPNAQACVSRWGKSASWQKFVLPASSVRRINFLYVLVFDGSLASTTRKLPDSTPYFRSLKSETDNVDINVS